MGEATSERSGRLAPERDALLATSDEVSHPAPPQETGRRQDLKGGTAAAELARWDAYDRRVLAGLVRLPLSRPHQLAALLGVAEAAVQGALWRLRQRGWARDIAVSTQKDIVRLWLPSRGVWTAYEAAGVDLTFLVAADRSLEKLSWDSTEALAVAELLGNLAQGARQRGLQVAEALRLRPSAPGAVYAGAQGMALLIGEEWCSPLFVLVDRQETAPRQRRELARQWTRLLAERPFMAGAMLLVVTPTREEMDQWDFYTSASRERKSTPPPPVYMATASGIVDPWRCRWERVDGKGSLYLASSLHRLAQAPLDLPLPFRNARSAVLPDDRRRLDRRGTMVEQPSPAVRRALVTLLRHPACRTEEMAALAGLSEEEQEKVLAGLVERGLARQVDDRWTVTKEGDRLGRRLLGVSPTASSAFPRPSLLPHHLEVRSLLAALARQLREMGGKVLSLREAPTTRREWHEGGRLLSLVPDGSLVFTLAGHTVYALLEWDRGQMFTSRWQRKLSAYRGYYRHLLRHGRPFYMPFLLVIAPDPTREETIAATARDVLPAGMLPLVWTSNRLVLESRGVLGAAWQRGTGGSRDRFYMGNSRGD
jgi:hypothetical protein